MTYVKASIGVVLLMIAGAVLWYVRTPQQGRPTENTNMQAAAVTVSMSDMAYSTTTINIRKGEVIAFRNDGTEARWPASDLHPTHELYSDFDPRKPVLSGETWSFAFEQCGRWRFHDHLKPSIRGVIEVTCNGASQ